MPDLIALEDHEAALCLALTTAAYEAAELLDEAIGAVPPPQRGVMKFVVGKLRSDGVAKAMLRDNLTDLEEQLRPLIDAGTRTGWHIDERYSEGAWQIEILTPDARLLRRTVEALSDVRAASTALATFLHAIRIRANLPLP